MNEQILKISDLHKSYMMGKNRIYVLKGVNLSIDKGKITTLQGVSGVGKSTLLNIIGTLDRPDSGEVVYEGNDVFKQDKTSLLNFRNKNIGFIFQFHHLLAEFSALENAMIPCLISGLPDLEARQRAEKLLERVGLSKRLSHRPRELSGGEQQRVAVARALVNDPMLVLADEPTGNLDSVQSLGLFDLIYELASELKKTFLIVTHNQEIAGKSDSVFNMIDGVIE
jgi:lipoprotein-releasing system ATP-binding protein